MTMLLMSEEVPVIPSLATPSAYKDGRSEMDRRRQKELLAKTSTLYLGNLSFYTTEEQIHELFSSCAGSSGIRRIIMGLDRNTRTPCGFAFVEYYTHQEAVDAMLYINGTKLDERIVRCDLDAEGFVDGRQFGRGRSGGQVRDEYREEFDPGRGGWGHVKALEEAERQNRERLDSQMQTYSDRDIIPVGAGEQYVERQGSEADSAVRNDGRRKRGMDEDHPQRSRRDSWGAR